MNGAQNQKQNKTERNGNGEVYLRGSSYYHKVKKFNADTGETSYTQKGGFKSYDDAYVDWLASEKEYEKARKAFHTKPDDNITFKDYLTFWLDNIYAPRIEKSTYSLSSYLINSLIVPNITTDVKIKYVTTDYLNDLLDVASKMTKSAGHECRGILIRAFKDAVIHGYISKDPASTTKTYPRKKPEFTILNKEQIRSLLAAAVNGEWYLEILLALFMGLRKGEIYGLKFSDIDTANRILTVNRQMVYEDDKLTEKDPKTMGSKRRLKIPEQIMEEISNRRILIDANKLKCPSYYDNDLISCSKDGRPHGPSSFNIALNKLCSRNNLPHISVHGLRHMYATILLEQGVPLVKVSALMGHASINTTFEYYCDVMNGKEEIVDFMNENFKIE